MRNEPWTAPEVDVLRQHYPEQGIRGCVPLLPRRNAATIIAKADKLGIKRIRGRDKIAAASEAILTDYRGGMSVAQIRLKHGFSRALIDKTIKKAGLRIRGSGTYHSLPYDKAYFENIDSHEKAYWLGYLGADGCISGHLVTVLTKDVGHLEKLKRAMSAGQSVSHNAKGYHVFQIKCKALAKQIRRLGMLPRKSLKHPFPNLDQVPAPYINSYILGYFDGDGCITYRSVGKHTYWQFSIIASLSFARTCRKILCETLELRKTRFHKHATSPMFSVTFGGTASNRVRLLYDYLYRDIPADIPLERKKKRFIHLITNCPVSTPSSRYYGVTRRKGSSKWVAQKRLRKGVTICLGSFDSETEAAKAVDAYLIKRGIHLDRLNFPQDTPKPSPIQLKKVKEASK